MAVELPTLQSPPAAPAARGGVDAAPEASRAVAPERLVSLDAYRFETLDPLYEMAARVNLLEVA